MNKTTTLALACAFGLAASTVQAKDLTGWFVNGGVGTAHYSAEVEGTGMGTESDTSAQITAGWRSQFIGVEAGYVRLGKVERRAPAEALIGTDVSDLRAKLSGDGWTVGLNGHFNPTDKWYISARGGLFLWKLHGEIHATPLDGEPLRLRENRQSADWYAGVGTGVDFNRHMSLGINFDFYKIDKAIEGYSTTIDSKVWTVNFEYRF